MIQNNAFCQQHYDYMIEVVCVDYMNKECKYMCKKCYKQFNKSINQEKDEEFKKKQDQFWDKCKQYNGKLNNYFNQKNEKLQEEFKSVISAYLKKINGSFCESYKLIESFVSEKVDNQNLKQTIQQQQQKMNELRIESITNKANHLNELKNQLIEIVLNLEDQIFSEHLLGQQLYQIPNLETIFQNFDTNNLLLSFEQHYHLKYQYFKDEDIEYRKKQYEEELKQLEQENNKINKNLDEQYKKIEIELDDQKQKMLARFQKYQNWINQNIKDIKNNRQKNQLKETEIQMMKNEEFEKLLNQELANKQLKNYFDEFRETISKICHIGFYDIKVSLKEIESQFMVKFIPKTMLNEINRMENNIPMQYPEATQMNAKLNQKGDLSGNAIIQESNGQVNIQISDNEQQRGNSIMQHQNKTLFNFDLSKLFPNSQNKFNYKLTRTDKGEEQYKEDNNQWELIQSQNDPIKMYTFRVYPNTSKFIRFNDIVINSQGQVDENNIQKVIYSDQNHFYDGQINNCFQYSGQGKLTSNGVIKDGMWMDGKLEGQGKIIENNIEIYVGEFKNGLKHGQGTEYLIEDLYYNGPFENDEKHGQGKLVKKVGKDFLTIEENVKWKNGQSQDDICKIF